MAAHGGDRCFEQISAGGCDPQHSLMSWLFLGPVDVAGAKGVFLGVDAVLHEAAVGAHDPPSRAVEPADPAGFNLKEHSVEFEDDPPVPAGIDAVPGCRRDPGAEPAARPQAELECLVDQVRTPVVEDRAGRGGAAAPRSRWRA